MMGSESRADYDAAVVGASLAGCTAAILLAQAGARVALLEQRPDPAAYKRICSHLIMSSAVPVLERLGLLGEIEARGAVRSRVRLRTPWGWIASDPPGIPRCVNLRREHLDPLIRARAAETPGVELRLGARVDALCSSGGSVTGVETVERDGTRRRLRARVVIGADGRDSRVAELAEVPRRTWRHGRFAYGGYFEGPAPAAAPDATVWLLDPDMGAAFPTDAGLTFYGCMAVKQRLPEFRADPAAALQRFIAALPDAPPIEAGRLVSPVQGKLDMTNVMRGPVAPGLALVGDAALATDPLWGVGCGFALQSGEWAADCLAPALLGEAPLASALRRYRRSFRRGLGGHARIIHDYSSGRRLQPPERLLFAAASHDRHLAELFERFGTRTIGPGRFLGEAVPRSLVVQSVGRLRRPASAAAPSASPA